MKQADTLARCFVTRSTDDVRDFEWKLQFSTTSTNEQGIACHFDVDEIRRSSSQLRNVGTWCRFQVLRVPTLGTAISHPRNQLILG